MAIPRTVMVDAPKVNPSCVLLPPLSWIKIVAGAMAVAGAAPG